MTRQFTDEAGTIYTAAALSEDSWLLSHEDDEEQIQAHIRPCADGTYLVERGGVTRPVQVSRAGDVVWISTAAGTTRWTRYEKRREVSAGSGDGVSSPMTGKIVVLHVAVGDTVSAGDVLVVVEAMKMEQPLAAPRDGVVGAVSCAVGDLVDGGVELVSLVPASAATEELS